MTDNDQRQIAEQAFVTTATSLLQQHGSDSIDGERYDNTKVLLQRNDETGLQLTITLEDLVFDIRREGGVWEVYETSPDGEQVYPANSDDLQGFTEMLSNTSWEGDSAEVDNPITDEELLG